MTAYECTTWTCITWLGLSMLREEKLLINM
jgi:hypothetical protein